jgi:hypothetical protein
MCCFLQFCCLYLNWVKPLKCEFDLRYSKLTYTDHFHGQLYMSSNMLSVGRKGVECGDVSITCICSKGWNTNFSLVSPHGFLICLSEVKWAQIIYPLKLRNVYFMSSNLLNKRKLLLSKTHVSQSHPFYWESFAVWCGLFEPWKEIYLLLQELKHSYMYVNQNCWWLFYGA